MAIGGFVIQAILILVAPALYAASIYMILARLIRAINAQQLSIVPVSWLTRIFVTGDIVSFIMQAGGGGVQAAGTLDLYYRRKNYHYRSIRADCLLWLLYNYNNYISL